MDFAELVFRRFDESWIEPSDYIDWANALLEDGCEAPGIWELAFLRWHAYADPEEVERLFQACMSELGLELPGDWYDALCLYSSSICEKMLRGGISPSACLHEILTMADDHDPPIHWIWIDLYDDLDQQNMDTGRIRFNGKLDLDDPEECIRIVARQFIALCSISLPERFPCIWRCEICEETSEESTFDETKACDCPKCGSAAAMKNMRFFEHRDHFIRTMLPAFINAEPEPSMQSTGTTIR